MTTKEICSYLDKEDGFVSGTHYRQHCTLIVTSIVSLIFLVTVLFCGLVYN